MTFDRNRRLTTDEWEAVIGAEVRAARIARPTSTRSELAARADISLGAVKNLEAGKGSTLKTLVRVVRALGRTEWLESLTPPITVSPMAMLSSRRPVSRPASGSPAADRRRPSEG